MGSVVVDQTNVFDHKVVDFPLVVDVVEFVVDGQFLAKESRLIEDLEVDSLDALDLIFKLEEEFNIEIPEGQLPFVTVQDVITYVREKTKGE